MEEKSSRRSSNKEHELIANTMHHSLARKGIVYERQGIRYRDSRADFNRLFNAYRKCFRLYEINNGATRQDWCHGVGGAQREVMWLLQRLCERRRTFFPLGNFKISSFQRDLRITKFIPCSWLNKSRFVSIDLDLCELGSKFAIVKGKSILLGVEGYAELTSDGVGVDHVGVDLVALSQLVESGKANVSELTAESDLQSENIDSNLREPGML